MNVRNASPIYQPFLNPHWLGCIRLHKCLVILCAIALETIL